MAEPRTIVIADDHPIFRKGLRATIEARNDITVLGEAADGEEALRLIEQHAPHLAVLDVEMPKLSGFDLLALLRERRIATKAVFLTMYKEEALFNKALDLGAQGYLLKENAATDILLCLDAVLSGKYYISPILSDYLVRRSDRSRSFERAHPSVADLTVSEKRILTMISESKTSKEIADILHISYKTVERHRVNIAAKLNLHGSHALLKFAIEHKAEF